MLNYIDNMPLLYLSTFISVMLSTTYYLEVQTIEKNVFGVNPYFTDKNLKKAKQMLIFTSAISIVLAVSSLVLFFNIK